MSIYDRYAQPGGTFYFTEELEMRAYEKRESSDPPAILELHTVRRWSSEILQVTLAPMIYKNSYIISTLDWTSTQLKIDLSSDDNNDTEEFFLNYFLSAWMNMDVDVMPTIGKNDVSNFRFIKTYSLGLKPKNGNYYEGVTFDQLNCIAPIQIFVHFFFS